MKYVPVVSSSGQPLMPCHAARARELVRRGRAQQRFDRGLFYIQLTDRASGERQPIAIGIDPGSRKEALTVKSAAHTYLNIQADAVTWVSEQVAERRAQRRSRRSRKATHHRPRSARRLGGLPPSTRARWGWKLRLCRWLLRSYPVTNFVIEDVAVEAGENFSPLRAGKDWFYTELSTLASVRMLPGDHTNKLRTALGLKKSRQKLSDRFEAHCLDSWVLANAAVGGHRAPDDTTVLYIIPLRLRRRQLHQPQTAPGGIRERLGGTRCLGFKRGMWVKHSAYGVVYVDGAQGDRLVLRSLQSGQVVGSDALPQDCQRLTWSSWRIRK